MLKFEIIEITLIIIYFLFSCIVLWKCQTHRKVKNFIVNTYIHTTYILQCVLTALHYLSTHLFVFPVFHLVYFLINFKLQMSVQFLPTTSAYIALICNHFFFYFFSLKVKSMLNYTCLRCTIWIVLTLQTKPRPKYRIPSSPQNISSCPSQRITLSIPPSQS